MQIRLTGEAILCSGTVELPEHQALPAHWTGELKCYYSNGAPPHELQGQVAQLLFCLLAG